MITSEVDFSATNGKGKVRIDWSGYDILDKYFVIYRRQEGEEEWKNIMSLDEKFNGSYFVDSLGNDKGFPSEPEIIVKSNENANNVSINVSSIDSGTKYLYYIEAYDADTMKLLSKSN